MHDDALSLTHGRACGAHRRPPPRRMGRCSKMGSPRVRGYLHRLASAT